MGKKYGVRMCNIEFKKTSDSTLDKGKRNKYECEIYSNLVANIS